MTATAWTITTFYTLCTAGFLIAYLLWWTTRKDEDHIWRWIFTFLGGIIFASFFWLSYWIGTLGLQFIIWIALGVFFVWFYLVLSTRSHEMSHRIVFGLFGTFGVGLVCYGGFVSGARGWWGMAIPFYFAALHTVYSLLEVD